jgi:hypothetical protein
MGQLPDINDALEARLGKLYAGPLPEYLPPCPPPETELRDLAGCRLQSLLGDRWMEHKKANHYVTGSCSKASDALRVASAWPCALPPVLSDLTTSLEDDDACCWSGVEHCFSSLPSGCNSP